MTPSVQPYYIDSKKSGAVLRSFIDQRGLSLTTVESLTGIDYDTLRNYLSGKIQKVTIDCLLKILSVTEYTLEDYFRAYAAMDPEALRYERVFLPAPSEKPTAAPAAKTEKCAALEQYIDRIERAQEQALKHVSDTHIQHIDTIYQKELEVLEKRHDKSVEHLKDQIRRLEKRATRLTVALIAENLIVISILLYDITHLDVGWFRGLYTNNISQMLSIKS